MNLSEPIVIVVPLIAAGMGVFGLASPAGMITFVSTWQSKSGLWVASAIRLVFGIALWAAAGESRFPATLKVLSVVSLASFAALPLMGVSRFKSILAWWSQQSPVFIRAWSAVAVLMGVFLICSVTA
jgi:hypothetical protein